MRVRVCTYDTQNNGKYVHVYVLDVHDNVYDESYVIKSTERQDTLELHSQIPVYSIWNIPVGWC